MADDAKDGHPRLWIREADLARLRAWANDANPTWAQGVKPRLEEARRKADAGDFLKATSCSEVEPYCESFAMLFALGALVDPDPAQRKKDAERGRAILVASLSGIEAKRAEFERIKPQNLSRAEILALFTILDARHEDLVLWWK